jgi:hypothetical protein
MSWIFLVVGIMFVFLMAYIGYDKSKSSQVLKDNFGKYKQQELENIEEKIRGTIEEEIVAIKRNLSRIEKIVPYNLDERLSEIMNICNHVKTKEWELDKYEERIRKDIVNKIADKMLIDFMGNTH